MDAAPPGRRGAPGRLSPPGDRGVFPLIPRVPPSRGRTSRPSARLSVDGRLGVAEDRLLLMALLFGAAEAAPAAPAAPSLRGAVPAAAWLSGTCEAAGAVPLGSCRGGMPLARRVAPFAPFAGLGMGLPLAPLSGVAAAAPPLKNFLRCKHTKLLRLESTLNGNFCIHTEPTLAFAVGELLVQRPWRRCQPLP